MITCSHCKTINPPEQRQCQNCHRDLLPGRGFLLRIGVLIVSLAIGAFGAFILYRLSQGAELPDLGCAITSPVFWALIAGGVPLMGLVFAVQRTPQYEKYVDRAKRHLQIDPEQALADLNEAIRLAPEKQMSAILKERSALLVSMGHTTDAVRDKIAAMEGGGAYENEAGFATLIGADRDTMVGGIKSTQQQEMVKAHAAVGLGWCKKCKSVVELDEAMHCKLHPTAKISDVHLAVPEDVPAELARLHEEITRRDRSLRTRRITLLIAFVLIVAALCYLTNQ